MTAPTLPLHRTTGVTARLKDALAETMTMARTLRASAREIARLEDEGYRAGEERMVDFALCVAEPTSLAAALADVRAAGFTVGDTRRADRGAATVRTSVRLSAIDLARTSARLNRLAERHEGFVEVVGVAEKP